jgi:hypothetical protein
VTGFSKKSSGPNRPPTTRRRAQREDDQPDRPEMETPDRAVEGLGPPRCDSERTANIAAGADGEHGHPSRPARRAQIGSGKR